MSGVILCSQVLQRMLELESQLPDTHPAELLPLEQDQTEAFWMEACRQEMQRRDTVSELLKEWINKESASMIYPLDAWLIRLRIQWAQHLLAEMLERNSYPPFDVPKFLDWLLVETWNQDGCIGLWLHAERGGVRPDENE